MQNRPNAESISSANTRIEDKINATCSINKPPKSDWKRRSAIAGAAVTSAGIVLPLAGEKAIAYEGPHSLASSAGIAQSASIRQQAAQRMVSAIKPQAFAIRQASFSDQARLAGSNALSATLQTALSKSQGATLALSYQLPKDASLDQAQAVIANLVNATAVSAATNTSTSTSTSASNQPAELLSKATRPQQPAANLAVRSTADSKLFAAREQVQQVQQKIASFEAERGQQDIAAYRNVLASRTSEIAEQGTQLAANIERNQRVLTQLKMQLLSVNADVSLPEQVLAADEEYQAVWTRLKKAEQNMLDEFSAANVDGTRLNEIYGDYKYHQQWLAKAAEQAFPKYLTANAEANIDTVAQVPVAIDLMQNLVMATHEERVQQLRQETLDTISQRLKGRQSQLAADIGTYEQLQRELSAATETVARYENQETRRASAAKEQLKGQLVSNVSTAPAKDAKTESAKSPVSQARLLAPYFPDGTLAKTLLGIAIAAGALATAIAAHRNSQKDGAASIEPLASTQSALEPLEAFSVAPVAIPRATGADFSSFGLHGESIPDNSRQANEERLNAMLSSIGQDMEQDEAAPSISTDALLAELLEITRGDETLTAYQPASAKAKTEASLAAELSEIVNGVNAERSRSMPALTAEAVEEILGVEVIVQELEAVMNIPGPALVPSQRLSKKTAAITDPIKLSVREVDLFAEQVIRWVLNDLGFQVVNSSNMAAES